MSELKKTRITKISDAETAESLRKVSQRIYNLRKIIDAHLIEPIEEDKDLNLFFLNEIDELNKLLNNPKIISFGNIYRFLTINLMFNRGKTKASRRELDIADDFIRVALGKVQAIRHKYYGSSIPTQGLEEGPLKVFLGDFLSQKRIVTDAVTVKPKLKIEYNVNLGQFMFDDSVPIKLEGKQKDAADCLVASGKDKKVSWDEIYDSFKDATTDLDLPNPAELDAQRRSVRTAVKGINDHAKPYLQQKQDFIGAKDNEYWLQYEVDKGR